jgi:hypothetical protein
MDHYSNDSCLRLAVQQAKESSEKRLSGRVPMISFDFSSSLPVHCHRVRRDNKALRYDSERQLSQNICTEYEKGGRE